MSEKIEELKFRAAESTVRDSAQYIEHMMRYALDSAVHEIEDRLLKDPSLCEKVISTADVAKSAGLLATSFANIIDRCKLDIAKEDNPKKTQEKLENLKKSLIHAMQAAYNSIGMTLEFRPMGAELSKGISLKFSSNYAPSYYKSWRDSGGDMYRYDSFCNCVDDPF